MSLSSTVGARGEELTQVFVHDLTCLGSPEDLDRTLPGFTWYDHRALLLAGPRDIVCVRHAVDSRSLQYLAELGIGPRPEHVLVVANAHGVHVSLAEALLTNPDGLRAICERLTGAGGIVVSPYIATRGEFELARDLARLVRRRVDVLGGNPEIVARVNRKHEALAVARELGVPVAPGEVVELPNVGGATALRLREAVRRHLGPTGRVIVRGSEGFSGSSTLIVDDAGMEGLEGWLRLRGAGVYVVQVMLDLVSSPNIQLLVDPGGSISCVGVTDQKLDRGLHHHGNVFPSRATTVPEMTRSASRLGAWLRSEGFTGPVGFDFAEYVRGKDGRRSYVLAEINARVNAAIYASCLVERWNVARARTGRPAIRAFLSETVSTGARSFRALEARLGRLVFHPESEQGVVPYNTGCLSRGRCTLALLGGSREEVEELYQGVASVL